MKILRDTHHGATRWLVGMACLILLAVFRLPDSNWLDVDFQTLLPNENPDHWVSVAENEAANTYAATLVWMIEGNSKERVLGFAQEIKERLGKAGYADPSFEINQRAKWKKLTNTLLAHRRGLITPADYQLLVHEPARYFQDNRRLLYSPLGGAIANWIETDPSGLFPNYLNHVTPRRTISEQGEPGQTIELLVVSVPPEKLGFTSLPELYRIYEDLREQAREQQLALYATGAPLYTAYGVQSAQWEVSTLGAASLLLLITLLFFSLRSFTSIILTTICIFSGVAAGFLVTVIVFQRIHILTVVFGASLIGIAADYALHYLAHSRSEGWLPEQALEKVYKALKLSMFSSVVAFSSLLILPFPAIQQIGLFMASGLICSFFTVCLLFPAFFKGLRNPAKLAGIWTRPRWYWRHAGITVIALIVIASASILRTSKVDDVRAFYSSPQPLAQSQQYISDALASAPDTRFLLLQAPNKASLLALEAQLADDLSTLQTGGAIGGYSGISTLIPSLEAQARSAALLGSGQFTQHFSEHMNAIGLRVDLQAKSLAYLREPYEPLLIDALEHESLPIGTGGVLGCNKNNCASRVSLAGINSIAELQASISKHPQVQLVDQIANINATMKTYREAMAYLLIVAAVLVSLLLSLYCGWRVAAGILIAPLATCFFSLIVVAEIQGGINLINLMALLLLIGISLDYGIFRALTPAPEQGATALAISLSAATSILAFGMLSFSETPVIRSFGLTIAVGLSFAWAFSWIKFSAEGPDAA